MPKIGKKPNPWGEWLGPLDWTHWCTFTTRYTLTLPSARRLMSRMFDMKASPSITSGHILDAMFWAAEPFDARDGHHTHALLRVTKSFPVSVKLLADAYQVAAGNKSKRNKSKAQGWHRLDIQTYNKKLGAGHYCGKYITKRLSDYDIWERQPKEQPLESGIFTPYVWEPMNNAPTF